MTTPPTTTPTMTSIDRAPPPSGSERERKKQFVYEIVNKDVFLREIDIERGEKGRDCVCCGCNLK